MNIKAWMTQVTTGSGGAAILGTLSAVASGTITWQQAIPVIVSGVALIAFPENQGLANSAATLATDAETAIPMLLTAYRTGLQHGASSVAKPAVPAVAPVAQRVVTPPAPTTT